MIETGVAGPLQGISRVLGEGRIRKRQAELVHDGGLGRPCLFVRLREDEAGRDGCYRDGGGERRQERDLPPRAAATRGAPQVSPSSFMLRHID